MAIYELKYEDDIIDAIDIHDKLSDIWTELEHMKPKYAEIDDTVSICLNVIQHHLSIAMNCIVVVIPEDSI